MNCEKKRSQMFGVAFAKQNNFSFLHLQTVFEEGSSRQLGEPITDLRWMEADS